APPKHEEDQPTKAEEAKPKDSPPPESAKTQPGSPPGPPSESPGRRTEDPNPQPPSPNPHLEDQPPKGPFVDIATEFDQDRKPKLHTGGDVLIKDAVILPVSGPTIPQGSILVRGGKIA